MKGKVKISLSALSLLLLVLPLGAQGIKEVTGSFLEPLEPRDSILIADQMRYGFTLDDVEAGTGIALQDWEGQFGDTLIVVKNWQIDTLKTFTPKKKSSDPARYNVRGYLVLAPFEAAEYHLPRIALQRTLPTGEVDTLLFDEQVMDVRTMPVDTTTYVLHDIKGQIRYPLTFKEMLPYILGVLLLAGLVVLLVILIRRRKAAAGQELRRDPAYIVALRKLDRFRGEKFWAPDKQKTFYSGITDTLREYIAETFGIDACEMTTAEIFDALKGNERISKDLYADTKDLFEVADFVKFAKHVVGDDDNVKALPRAVGFVTATYQEEIEEETASAAQDHKNEGGAE